MLDIFKGTVTRQDWLFVGLVLVITAVLVVGFYFVLYNQQQKGIRAKLDDLSAINKELQEARKIKTNIKDLREESQRMERLVGVFEKRLPDEREIPLLLSRFEQLGGALGLRVQLVSLPTRITERVEVIPYRVTAFGQFHQIVSFINLLERDERYLKISDIDINEEKDGVSEAVFVLSTFRFIQTGSEGEK